METKTSTLTGYTTISLTGNDKHTIVHGLTIAAERFDEDAKACAFNARLAAQFVQQAADSRRLASAISDADEVKLQG
jgi:hypothetical protein